MSLSLSFHKALTLWPDREALVESQKRFTYRQFGQRVFRAIKLLTIRGVGKGDRVAILAPNGHQFMEAYYACALSGAVLVPINFRLAALEVSAILNDSEAMVLIAHTDFAGQVEAALASGTKVKSVFWTGSGACPELNLGSLRYEMELANQADGEPELPCLSEADLAQLYYTSGTTGNAKGVMLTHGNVSFHALSAVAELGLSDTDTWLHAAPMFHLADAWATFAMTWVGAKHVFVPYFRADYVLECLERERITVSNLVPTMLTALVSDQKAGDYDYSSLRMILSGGAPIAPETVRRIVARFDCDYTQTYGMTETSPYLTLSCLKSHLKQLPADQQLAIKSRTGRPFIAVELKVVREDGSPVKADDREVGEIIVKGPTVTAGYWRKPAVTAETIKNGWLHTGDLAVIDSEGYVNIVDRKKDMIITGGENVYSTEVEHVIYEHPAVLECAVFGVPSTQWGEAVTAAVVRRDQHEVTESELLTFVRSRLAAYKSPKQVYFVGELPKTGSGKIVKKALREMHQLEEDASDKGAES
jgi:acyl-CoA synthetase (AMP-forming)/AMP-acid ligase II